VRPTKQKQAAPLQLRHLEKAVNRLDRQAEEAIKSGDYRALMRCRRDAVLLLIGFWRGFRGEELARLQVEDTQAEAGIDITFYLPYTKGGSLPSRQHLSHPRPQEVVPSRGVYQLDHCGWHHQGPTFRKLDQGATFQRRDYNKPVSFHC
jgi:hypothetical protein